MASEISSLSMRSARRSSVMCAACWRSASRSLTPGFAEGLRPRRAVTGGDGQVLRAALSWDVRADVAQLVEHFTRNEGSGFESPRRLSCYRVDVSLLCREFMTFGCTLRSVNARHAAILDALIWNRRGTEIHRRGRVRSIADFPGPGRTSRARPSDAAGHRLAGIRAIGMTEAPPTRRGDCDPPASRRAPQRPGVPSARSMRSGGRQSRAARRRGAARQRTPPPRRG